MKFNVLRLAVKYFNHFYIIIIKLFNYSGNYINYKYCLLISYIYYSYSYN